MSVIRVATHTLFPGILDQSSVVLDLGANRGAFSLAMGRTFGCRCHAVEPSPVTFDAIPAGPLLSKHNLAIAGSPGVIPFHLGADTQASSVHHLDGQAYVGTVSVRAETLQAFLREIGLERVDLIKMDIEGCEIAVLDSCTDGFLATVGQITVEFHEWAASSGVTPEAVRRVFRRMRALGFHVYKTNASAFYDVLFLNRRRVPRWRYFSSVWCPRVYGYVRRRILGRTEP